MSKSLETRWTYGGLKLYQHTYDRAPAVSSIYIETGFRDSVLVVYEKSCDYDYAPVLNNFDRAEFHTYIRATFMQRLFIKNPSTLRFIKRRLSHFYEDT